MNLGSEIQYKKYLKKMEFYVNIQCVKDVDMMKDDKKYIQYFFDASQYRPEQVVQKKKKQNSFQKKMFKQKLS